MIEADPSFSIESEKIHPQPRVMYSGAVLDKDCPYTVLVDPQKYGEFLGNIGLTSDQIENLTVNVNRKSPDNGTQGEYFDERKTIELYVDPDWKSYDKALKKVDRIIKGRKVGKDPFPQLSTTRLPSYLAQAPEARGEAFAEKLLRKAWERELDKTAYHEGSHAVDYLSGLFSKEAKTNLLHDKAFRIDCLTFLAEFGITTSIGIGSGLSSTVAILSLNSIVLRNLWHNAKKRFTEYETVAESKSFTDRELAAQKMEQDVHKDAKFRGIMKVLVRPQAVK